MSITCLYLELDHPTSITITATTRFQARLSKQLKPSSRQASRQASRTERCPDYIKVIPNDYHQTRDHTKCTQVECQQQLSHSSSLWSEKGCGSGSYETTRTIHVFTKRIDIIRSCSACQDTC
jgi:hypothetical protein